MSIINPDIVADILVECADAYILPRYNMLEAAEISTKTGPRDLVTQADLDVEEHLNRVLPDLLPGSKVMGEEGVSSGLIPLDSIRDKSRPLWIVDPVDGTYNFVHGKREFGVMLGLIIDGVTQFGWIYDVLGSAMYIGERGEGAFCEGVRLQVASSTIVSEMSGYVNPRFFPANDRAHVIEQRDLFKECQSIGCAAHEYLRVARGDAQFAMYSKLKPWDHVPGALIVQEAGGVVSKWSGETYEPDDYHTGIIAAASEENWQSVHDVFL